MRSTKDAMLRKIMLLGAAVLASGLLGACSGETAAGSATPPGGSTPTVDTGSPSAAASAPETSAPPSAGPPATAPPGGGATGKAKPAAAPLTCAQLRDAHLGSPSVPYNGYADYIPLFDGRWAGEDGAEVELQKPCGTGDLDGDGAADALGVVKLHTGETTGRFFTLVFWRNVDGSPVYRTLRELGDRTPVASITVSAGEAKVVYYTRNDDDPMAMLSIKRTAVYRVSGTTLTEVGHTDVPYSG